MINPNFNEDQFPDGNYCLLVMPKEWDYSGIVIKGRYVWLGGDWGIDLGEEVFKYQGTANALSDLPDSMKETAAKLEIDFEVSELCVFSRKALDNV